MSKSPTAEDWVAGSCTLPTVEQPLRLAEFDDLLRSALRRSIRTSATRLDLVISRDGEATSRDLAARETSCCSFFRFTFDHVHDGLAMGIGVPNDYVDVLDALQARVLQVTGVETVNDEV